MASNDENIPHPAFKQFTQAQYEIFNQSFISIPVFDDQKVFVCTLQVESKYHIQKGKEVTSKNKQYTGFQMIDRIVLNMIGNVLKLKLDQLQAIRKRKEMQEEVLETIKIAGIICNQRSLAELVKHIKILLPPFFGFE